MELLQIKMLNTAVERILNQEMSEMGLTYAQATVIGYLIENRDKVVCQRDIEYSLGLTHPTVSSILSRMESNGLVCTETQSADRRYKQITLSDKASGLSERISQKYRAVKGRLFNGITPEQQEICNATIQMLLRNVQ
ncbi:MAG: MarR family transcriptional regulator [Blautia sp.]|nr:MarR family transcriptional regulator [Blautia sp.]